MCFDLETWANVATAVFTAGTAAAALFAAWVAKSASEDSNKSAKKQTNALLTAARGNALASRINFYDRQIAEIESAIRAEQTSPSLRARLEKNFEQLKEEQRHLAYWLDRQLDSLGVRLRTATAKVTNRVKSVCPFSVGAC